MLWYMKYLYIARQLIYKAQVDIHEGNNTHTFSRVCPLLWELAEVVKAGLHFLHFMKETVELVEGEL